MCVCLHARALAATTPVLHHSWCVARMLSWRAPTAPPSPGNQRCSSRAGVGGMPRPAEGFSVILLSLPRAPAVIERARKTHPNVLGLPDSSRKCCKNNVAMLHTSPRPPCGCAPLLPRAAGEAVSSATLTLPPPPSTCPLLELMLLRLSLLPTLLAASLGPPCGSRLQDAGAEGSHWSHQVSLLLIPGRSCSRTPAHKA